MNVAPPVNEPWTATAPIVAVGSRRLVPVVVAALAGMLVGAAVTFSVIVLSGVLEPEHRYTVSVYLERDVSAEQKAAIEAALAGLDPEGDVQFESREDALRPVREALKDEPEMIPDVQDMPESFNADVYGPSFDCPSLDPLLKLDGIDTIAVTQRPDGDRPGQTVHCGNLLPQAA